jgi:hypothetical protein
VHRKLGEKRGTNEGCKTSTNPFGKYVLQTGIHMKLVVPVAGSSGVNNLKALYTP